MAAQQVLGASSIEDLLSPADGSLRIYPADHPEERQEPPQWAIK